MIFGVVRVNVPRLGSARGLGVGVINAIDDAFMKGRLIPLLKWGTRAQTRCKRLHPSGTRRERAPKTVLYSADNVV
jgi:hypothetical protein